MINRIVTTEPGSTEVIAYLDGGVERIVGVSDKCDYPPDVVMKPKVIRSILRVDDSLPSEEIDRIYREYVKSGEPLYEVDWSLIEDLDPDLIVGQTLCSVCAFPLISPLGHNMQGMGAKMPGMIVKQPVRFKRLRQRRIATYSPRTFLGIAREALMISKIIGREGMGEKMLWEFREAAEELRGLGRNMRAILIEWLKPLYIAGLWVSDLIEVAGSESLLRAGEEGTRVEWGSVRAFNPDLILISPCGFTIERTLSEIDIITSMPGWSDLKAVRSRRVYIVDSAYTSRPGPRVVKLARLLADLYTGSSFDREVAVGLYD